jgi:hypothetical protein
MGTNINLVEDLSLLALIIVIVLMFVIWRELRGLRGTLYELLLSDRENSRSLMAAIHEVASLPFRAPRVDPDKREKSRGEVD